MAEERRRGRGNVGVAALLLLCVTISGCRAWDCSATDKAVLLSFKAGFVDNGGVFSTWQTNSTNCCTWTGVKCQESDGAVIELAVVGSSGTNQQSYRYSGSNVGSGLIALRQLQKLKIQWVLFNDDIPSQWGDFSDNLISITVNYANLRDDIPSNLANINNLQTLDLKQNHLTGSIPSSFCTHQKITYIDVSNNDMSYILVPACLQGQNKISIIYEGQGQSNSPGSPGAGALLTVATSFVLAVGAFSSAFLLL